MRLLDLFCGAGGASEGYHRAGFDVVGVDLAPQPRYPFTFLRGNALRPPVDLADFDLVHASPPCQRFSAMNTMPDRKDHADLLTPTLAMLDRSGVPFVVENVPGAPLNGAVTLCGSMFGLGVREAQLRRHRLFKSGGWTFVAPRACQHTQPTIGVYGGHVRNRKRAVAGYARGVADYTSDEGRAAMGIPWMTLKEMSEAIPPAYTEHIGRQFLETQ